VFFAFDLVWLDHEDLRQAPLIERKKNLKKLIERTECSEILYAQHAEGSGKLFCEEVCEPNLEGIVAKRRIGVYAAHGWLKIKSPSRRKVGWNYSGVPTPAPCDVELLTRWPGPLPSKTRTPESISKRMSRIQKQEYAARPIAC
jgi:hypothetical protein